VKQNCDFLYGTVMCFRVLAHLELLGNLLLKETVLGLKNAKSNDIADNYIYNYITYVNSAAYDSSRSVHKSNNWNARQKR
jgi:hypothetical protein